MKGLPPCLACLALTLAGPVHGATKSRAPGPRAYQREKPAYFEKLIRGGWRLDQGTERPHYTPLMAAAAAGRADLVALFLSKGADPNQADDVGVGRTHCTPLYFAATAPKNDAATLEALLKAGAKVQGHPHCQRPPLNEAVQRSKLASVRLLLAKGADPNAMSLEGDIPLVAAFSGDGAEEPAIRPVVEELLRAGAAVNGRDVGGETALHRAARNLYSALWTVLLAKGADPRITNTSGYAVPELTPTQVNDTTVHRDFMTKVAADMKGPVPQPVFSRDESQDDTFWIGKQTRVAVAYGKGVRMLDPTGKSIGSLPQYVIWESANRHPQVLDLDGDGRRDLSYLVKAEKTASFSLALVLGDGQTRLLVNHDARAGRITCSTVPIPPAARAPLLAEVQRRTEVAPAEFERLLASCAQMADGAWLWDVEHRHERALELIQDHKPAEAAALLEEPLAEATVARMDPLRDPSVTEVMNDLGFFLSEAGLNDRAVPVLRRVVARAPDRAAARLNLADALYTLGDAAGARPHYAEYATLMKKAGKDRKIPGRVTDRLNEGKP